MSTDPKSQKDAYQLTKPAWLILTFGALVLGVGLALFLAPRLSQIKDSSDGPDFINYQIPVPETPIIKK